MSNTQVNQLVKANNPMNIKQVTANLVNKVINNAFSFLQTPSKPATKRTVVHSGYDIKEVEFGTIDALAALDKLNKPVSLKTTETTNPISSGLGW